jgi:hypothetical protein
MQQKLLQTSFFFVETYITQSDVCGTIYMPPSTPAYRLIQYVWSPEVLYQTKFTVHKTWIISSTNAETTFLSA